MPNVKGLEGCYVPLIRWGRWAEVLCDGRAGRLLVYLCGKSMVAKPLEEDDPAVCVLQSKSVSPNPPKDTDGRREDSGRGWVRELQGRWPGVLG